MRFISPFVVNRGRICYGKLATLVQVVFRLNTLNY